MACERCGGAVEQYELNGRDAKSCRECGYVDVPVEHQPDGGDAESWDDAIDRFQRKYADVTVSDRETGEDSTAADD